MKKIELEAKIKELELKIIALESRPVCYGHFCGCQHPVQPVQPTYPPTYPWYYTPTITTCSQISGTTSKGLPEGIVIN